MLFHLVDLSFASDMTEDRLKPAQAAVAAALLKLVSTSKKNVGPGVRCCSTLSRRYQDMIDMLVHVCM